MDQDGIYDSGEPPLPQASVTLNPGGIGAGCDQQGLWEIGVLPGTYSITPSTNYPYAQAYSPAVHAGNVPNMGDADTLNDFAATLIPNIQDLQTWLHAEPARPGFENRLFLNYQNYGTMPVNATLTLQWDADQQWVGSSVAPSNVSGNTATWDLGTLAIAAEGLLTVDLSTLAAVPLDTPIEHLLTASPVLGDEAPYDNVAVYNDVVVGSYDPNDKLLSPAAMSPAQLLDPTARIEYTVRFQNTGTFQAERVVILDTFPEGLILESIQFLASSHPNTWYLTGGVLHVIHNDIMLPDSTSDEPNSHGFIRFSIKPEPTLPNGSTISNIAHIVFDFNEPIITPPAVFTVDVLASMNEVQRGTWSLWPNPTRDLLRLTATHGPLANQPCVVRDITGRTVMTSNTSAAGDLPVGTLANGTYTVQIKGQVDVLRFVKE
ncbi:MAG: T9SS type A sorting domain-containing protein [Flavobacteriales bacterium]|nr:T9SS type A sorting domain-containing protein [Flavobacteriales bacterium]